MSSLYLLLMMELHPWTMQVGQVCMVMLCKIGVKYHCCWMSNKCFLDANNLTLLIMNFLMTQGGLKKKELVTRLVCFGVDGVSTFQGLKFGIIVQIQNWYSPFVTNVHCMAHQINLVVQTFSSLPLFSCIESLLWCIYAYFNHNPKRHLKFDKLVEIMETKGNKILWNIKIR